MKAIKRNHLVAIAVGAFLLSGSNLALAQAGDHKKENKSHSTHEKKVKPIKLKGGVGVLSLDTSTVVPTFQFDTSTVLPHIEIDEDHTPRFDTSTATSQWPPLQFPKAYGSHHGGDHDDGDDDDDDDDEDDDDSGILPSSPLGIRKG
ncbi:MAG: hypothetical protein Q8K86_08485 [Candidatus Nanopelagicaceae bacterium]|nr:hypothetical protein [Candidatus Nanopelagicaceae bacterium]